MAVFSKYVERVADKLEQAGLPKTTLSHALVGAAIAAWTIKLTYAVLIKKENEKSVNKNNFRSGKFKFGTLTPTQAETTLDDESKLAEAEKLLVEQQLKNNKNQLEPGLNKEFINQLLQLIKIMIPKPLCYETGLLGVHTLCLVSRTFLSIYVAALEGALVKYIVRKDVRKFGLILMKWFGIAVPATFVNSMIRFLECKLSLAFR